MSSCRELFPTFGEGGLSKRILADNARYAFNRVASFFQAMRLWPAIFDLFLVSDFFHVSFMQTVTGVGGSLSRANPAAVGQIPIPLPPLGRAKGDRWGD